MNSTFDQIGIHRLEAGGAQQNGGGTGALMVLRVVGPGTPRRYLRRNYHDLEQLLWSILDEERRQAKAVWGPKCR